MTTYITTTSYNLYEKMAWHYDAVLKKSEELLSISESALPLDGKQDLKWGDEVICLIPTFEVYSFKVGDMYGDVEPSPAAPPRVLSEEERARMRAEENRVRKEIEENERRKAVKEESELRRIAREGSSH